MSRFLGDDPYKRMSLRVTVGLARLKILTAPHLCVQYIGQTSLLTPGYDDLFSTNYSYCSNIDFVGFVFVRPVHLVSGPSSY